MLRKTRGLNGGRRESVVGDGPGCEPRGVPRMSALVALTFSLLFLIFGGTLGSGCQPAETGATTSTNPTTSDPAVTSTTTGGTGTTPVLSGNFTLCPDCHSRFDASVGKDGVLLTAFSHQLHFDQGAECEACHVVPTHREDGIAKPTMGKCFKCHSQDGGSAPPGACDACHPPGFDLKPSSHDEPDWLPTGARLDQVKAEHSVEALAEPEECAVCHAASFCVSCHKVDMPHPSDWVSAHPETARSVGSTACTTCHPDRNLCNTCHHTGFKPGGQSWIKQHRNVVASTGALACFECHNSATCAHCHTTGEYKAF